MAIILVTFLNDLKVFCKGQFTCSNVWDDTKKNSVVIKVLKINSMEYRVFVERWQLPNCRRKFPALYEPRKFLCRIHQESATRNIRSCDR
jgi:hypothetical protein